MSGIEYTSPPMVHCQPSLMPATKTIMGQKDWDTRLVVRLIFSGHEMGHTQRKLNTSLLGDYNYDERANKREITDKI